MRILMLLITLAGIRETPLLPYPLSSLLDLTRSATDQALSVLPTTRSRALVPPTTAVAALDSPQPRLRFPHPHIRHCRPSPNLRSA